MSPKKKTTSIGNFFSTAWKVITAVSCAIYRIIKTIFFAIFNFLRLVFDFLKTLFFGISVLIASLALLIFCVCIGFYFLGKTFGLTESQPFQESRDFWITVNSFMDEQAFLLEFEKEQLKLPENERFIGEMPQIIVPKDENEKKMKILLEYLSSSEEKEAFKKYLE